MRWVGWVDVRACKTARPSMILVVPRSRDSNRAVLSGSSSAAVTWSHHRRRSPLKVTARVTQSIAAMRYPESKSTQNTGVGLRQPMISSFFSQPSRGAGADPGPLLSSRSPIDLTISDDDEQPTKKRKTTHGPTSDSNTQSQHQSPPASRWRYVPSQSPEKAPVDPEVKKRREQFAKHLLADNSSFVDTTGPSDGRGLPSDHAAGEPNSSDVESDNEFKHLQELFARKAEQKKKRNVTQERSSKKQPELGPSGEPYTALELQVWSFFTDRRTKCS